VAAMPNGGSDCCGTCWFNARNKGEAGFAHAENPEPTFCTIRGFAIERPFETFCGNHPYRRPGRDPIPIGPAFVTDDELGRRLWLPSSDAEEIRQHLLELLRNIEEKPAREYPLGAHADETVVWQLGEFRETRAIPGLRRILSFRPDAKARPFARTRESLIDEANKALAKIG
jgi:hypothetical protein